MIFELFLPLLLKIKDIIFILFIQNYKNTFKIKYLK